MKKNIRIGRESDNDYLLTPNNSLSRYHATLEIKKNYTIILRDHSGNGTYVNGSKIHNSSIPVTYGADIKFANIEALNWGKIPKPKRERKLFLVFLLPLFALIGGTLYFYFVHDPARSPQWVKDKYETSVGLLVHSYWIKKKLGGDESIYIGYNKNVENPTWSDVDISLNKLDLTPFLSTGTGFVIDNKNANIITNRHVVEPTWSLNFAEKKENFYYRIDTTIAKKYPLSVNNLYVTDKDFISFIPSETDIDIENKSYKEKVAYFKYEVDSYVVTNKGYHRNKNIDLALLKSSAIKREVDNFYPINLKKDIRWNIETVEIGTDLTLLGYSGGIDQNKDDVSNTISMKPLLGSLSSKTNEYYLDMNIEAYRGASGSPVFDNRGKLIAILSSGYLSGGSRFGILAKHIQELIEEGADVIQY